VPQIRPLADIVHFKCSHTYLLTYLLITYVRTWTWRRKLVSSTTAAAEMIGRSVGRAAAAALTTARWKSSRPQNPLQSAAAADSVTISSMDSGSMQLAMSESMSDESIIGSGGETLDARQRADDARDLIPTTHDADMTTAQSIGFTLHDCLLPPARTCSQVS